MYKKSKIKWNAENPLSNSIKTKPTPPEPKSSDYIIVLIVLYANSKIVEI
jgi:hypothetical protein